MVEGIIETDLAEKVWLVVRPHIRTKKRKAEVAREIKDLFDADDFYVPDDAETLLRDAGELVDTFRGEVR
jgi:hypothetical protein